MSIPLAPKVLSESEAMQTNAANRTTNTHNDFIASRSDNIINGVVHQCGGSEHLRQALIHLRQAAQAVSSMIGTGSDVYCMVSAAPSETEKQTLFPIHAPLLTSALQNGNWGSSIACGAISDALSVVRKIAARRDKFRGNIRNICTSSNDTTTTDYTSSTPAWLRTPSTTARNRTDPNLLSSNPTYIFCNNDVMFQLNKIDSLTLANIYGAYFNNLFAEAKRLNLVSGPMNYKFLTPPWMKGVVNFVYGPTRNKTIPFTCNELPRKDILRGAGKKPLLCAIIAAWIRKEPTSSQHLVQLLRSKKLSISIPASAQNSEQPFLNASSPAELDPAPDQIQTEINGGRPGSIADN